MASGAPAYTISYFDIRGLAEVPRLILAAGGQEFKDDRCAFSRNADGSYHRGDWEERKKSAPYGQMPLLTLADGTVIAQSSAIVRFLSKKFHLTGANEIEAALIDAQHEAVQDLRKTYYTAKSDPTKAAEFFAKTLPEGIAYIEKNIKGDTYTPHSNTLNYADITLYYALWSLHSENKEGVEKVLAANPKVAAIHKAVPEQDKVKQYLAARKETPF